MYLIVGLGNPGKEYEFTRHNMGFNVIDKIIKDCGIKVSQSKFKDKHNAFRTWCCTPSCAMRRLATLV